MQRLGPVALELIDVADRAAQAGSEKSAGLRSAYEAVAGPLDSIYDANAGELDRMSKKVMDEDGDLDALYATAKWRDSQAIASQALYYLNWLHFYGARLYDDPMHTKLLEKAEAGFSEFAVGDRKSDLLIESLLGRGLCYLELGKTDFAVHDFRIVIDSKDASSERRAKAKVGLVEAYLRAGDVQKSLDASQEFARSTEEAPYLRFLRLRALMMAAKRGGSAAGGYRQEALRLMDQLRRDGGAWKDRAEALLATSVDDPAQWAAKASNSFAQWNVAKLLVQKGDYQKAAPLLEDIVKSDDPEAKRNRAEASYLLGLAEFRSGDYEKAAGDLQVAAAEKGQYQADASYLRFKSLEALIARQSTPELAQRFRQAATEYVTDHPDHQSVYEAYYRLGEMLQSDGKFADAIPMYVKVKGDPLFELRARFGTLQSQFELLGALPPRGPGAARRKELLAAIGRSLDDVDKGLAGLDKADASSDEFRGIAGKTAAMRAAYLSFAEGKDEQILAALKDYESKYPAQAELFPTVLRMRLEALQRLGRYAEAEAEVTAHGSVFQTVEQREAADALAKRFLESAARADKKGGAADAKAARQTALKLYEITLEDGAKGETRTKLTMARLYETTGEPAKAKDLYEGMLAQDPKLLGALRGLARLAEEKKDYPSALQLWERFGAATRPGDPPWYESKYEIARVTLASGNAAGACKILTDLRPAMPGLGDADLRAKLDGVYKKACD